jgi:hypothetical protein
LVRVSRCNDDGDALPRESTAVTLPTRSLVPVTTQIEFSFRPACVCITVPARASVALRSLEALKARALRRGRDSGARATTCAPPAPKAASAPTTASAATIVKEGRKPAMNAVGLARLPKAAKTEVATATPNAPLKRRRVVLTPEACPFLRVRLRSMRRSARAATPWLRRSSSMPSECQSPVFDAGACQ